MKNAFYIEEITELDSAPKDHRKGPQESQKEHNKKVTYFLIINNSKSSFFVAPKDKVVIPFANKNLYASSNG